MGQDGRIEPGRAAEPATLKCRRRCWRSSCGFSTYGSSEQFRAAGTVGGYGGKLPEKSELSWQGLGSLASLGLSDFEAHEKLIPTKHNLPQSQYPHCGGAGLDNL